MTGSLPGPIISSMPPRSRHLSARTFLFSPHAIQRFRERVKAPALLALSDDALEDELDRRLGAAAKTGARFLDSQGLGLAVEISGLAAAPFVLILRGDARGALRLVSTAIGRSLVGLLEFWEQDRTTTREILSPEYGEPLLLRWTEDGAPRLEEVPRYRAQRRVAELIGRGVPIPAISLWRPERINLSVQVERKST